MPMMWWTMFLCLIGNADYTTDIAEAVGGRYCPEVTAPGLAMILNVQSDVIPPDSFDDTVDAIRKRMGDPWMTFYLVTSKNDPDADPGAECGSTSRYWVVCFDRWMEYDSGRTECIHDCQVMGLAE